MKTITVKDETWQWLSKLKIELMHGDLDETVNYLKYELFEGENAIEGDNYDGR